MRWFTACLPLVAGASLALPVAAQTEVRLTTLDIQVSTSRLASGPVHISGRPAPTEPLVSGPVFVWGTVDAILSTHPVESAEAVQGPAALSAGGPVEMVLRAVYPNPLTHTARIPFDLPEAATVRLVGVDALGRDVAVLADGEMPAGRHGLTLDAGALAPGVYHARLTADASVGVVRFTVVR